MVFDSGPVRQKWQIFKIKILKFCNAQKNQHIFLTITLCAHPNHFKIHRVIINIKIYIYLCNSRSFTLAN